MDVYSPRLWHHPVEVLRHKGEACYVRLYVRDTPKVEYRIWFLANKLETCAMTLQPA
jgi:hypothetical protein